jgi:adhesin transport system membrane fusion protein
VTPAERGPLRVDQRTVVKVAAFDYTVHGTLEGVIREISPDTLIDERGERYFRVAIAVDGSSASRFPQPVSAGMTVTVDAVTGQRTVLQSVLAPVRGLADNALREAH